MSEKTSSGLVVNVDGVGVFVFGHRTTRNQIAIECEYSRLTESLPFVTDFLGRLATRMADLKVLTVSQPKGWGKTPAGEPTDDIDEMDGFDEDTYALIDKVWSALRDKEAAFRGKPVGTEAPREDDVGDGGTVVSPEVQPSAD